MRMAKSPIDRQRSVCNFSNLKLCTMRRTLIICNTVMIEDMTRSTYAKCGIMQEDSYTEFTPVQCSRRPLRRQPVETVYKFCLDAVDGLALLWIDRVDCYPICRRGLVEPHSLLRCTLSGRPYREPSICQLLKNTYIPRTQSPYHLSNDIEFFLLQIIACL